MDLNLGFDSYTEGSGMYQTGDDGEGGEEGEEWETSTVK